MSLTSKGSCRAFTFGKCVKRILRTVPMSFLWIGIFFADWTVVSAFNLDLRAPIIHSGPSNTLFGYSVALHRENGVNWLLVGAPKAETSQPKVLKGGAVYKCPTAPLNNIGDCEQIVLDTEGDGVEEQKSNQWMGATVRSSGIDSRVLVCAPRFVWKTVDEEEENEEDNEIYEPVGECFITSSDFNTVELYSPCRTDKVSDRTRKKLTHCQAGFSGDIIGQGVLLGTPGSYFNQGQLFVLPNATGGTQIQTGEVVTASRDDSYRGFAVTYGEFTGDDQPDIVSGTPRGESLLGQVEVLSSDLQPLHNFTGDQLGAYFGSTVITADVDGDGLDDLIVGAPMYSDQRSSYKDNWECGKIFIFYQESDKTKKTKKYFRGQFDYILGNSRQARFGYSITSLGDINYDGFEDIAVGAPYAGEDRKGRVYIFNGNQTGLMLQPTQVISPADLRLPDTTTTFGFSLGGGVDSDNNNYPDLLIGSQEADSVALLRARPVVHLAATTVLYPIGLDLINPETSITLEGGKEVTSFSVKVCFEYTGTHIPDLIDIVYEVQLDSMFALEPRALFYNIGEEDTPTTTGGTSLSKGRSWCFTKTAYVKPNIDEKIAPIQVSATYTLVEDEASAASYDIFPILSRTSQSIEPKQVYILNNCENNLCVPDLVIQSASLSTKTLVVGSEEPVTLNFHILNDGEDAFQATLKAHIPDGLQFVRVERSQSMQMPVTCTDETSTNIITCDMGNPLLNNYQLEFGLTLETSEVNGDKEKLNFYIIISSQNEEDISTLSNNKMNLTASVEVKATVRINNASNPENVLFISQDAANYQNTDIESIKQIGPEVEHIYDVRNDGPSVIGHTVIDISWPLFDNEDRFILYVIAIQPMSSCTFPPGTLNYVNLPLIRENGISVHGGIKKRQVTARQYERQDCSAAKCVTFSCSFDRLEPGQGYDIRIKSRFWNQTFVTSGLAKVEIVSTAHVQVLDMPYTISSGPLPTVSSYITTTALPEVPPSGYIAWWIILVAVLSGLLFLFLIVLALWKVGFFKRKKYQQISGEEDVNGKLAARSK